MRLRIIACIVLALMAGFPTFVLPPVFGVASYSTGLQAGEWALYSLSGHYAFNTTNTRMTVTTVQGTKVFVNFTDYPSSGFDPGVFWIDVSSGQSNKFSNNLFFAVSSGLNVNDPIFNNWTNITVTSVQTATCGGQPRSLVYSPNYNRSNQTVRIAWDQLTGVMCYYGAIDSNGSLQFALDNTTFWSRTPTADPYTAASEISIFIGLPLVILITIVFFRKRRTRNRKSRQ